MDVPLRGLVERLASGQCTVSDLANENSPETSNFFYWLSAFRLVISIELGL